MYAYAVQPQVLHRKAVPMMALLASSMLSQIDTLHSALLSDLGTSVN